MSEKFKDLVEIQNAANKTTIELDGEKGSISAGNNDSDGNFLLKTKDGKNWLIVDWNEIIIGGGEKQPIIVIKDRWGNDVHLIDVSKVILGNKSWPGQLKLNNSNGNVAINLYAEDVRGAVIEAGGNGEKGSIFLNGPDGKSVIEINGSPFFAGMVAGGNGVSGRITCRDAAGNESGILSPECISIKSVSIDGGQIWAGGDGFVGKIILKAANNASNAQIDGDGNFSCKNVKCEKISSECTIITGDGKIGSSLFQVGKLNLSFPSLRYIISIRFLVVLKPLALLFAD